MTNHQFHRINAEITEEELDKILNDIQVLNSSLKFLIGLTKQEKIELPKINRENRIFVEDIINTSKDNSDILPSYISIQDVEKNFKLFNQLDKISIAIEKLSSKIRDTQILCGSEAFSTSLMIYKMFQMAAKSGMPGVDSLVEKLKARFAKQGNHSSPEELEKPET